MKDLIEKFNVMNLFKKTLSRLCPNNDDYLKTVYKNVYRALMQMPRYFFSKLHNDFGKFAMVFYIIIKINRFSM